MEMQVNEDAMLDKLLERDRGLYSQRFLELSVPCLCMGELPAPPAPHFVFLITL